MYAFVETTPAISATSVAQCSGYMPFIDLRICTLLKEFPARNREYYESAFDNGKLRVENLKGVTKETLLPAGARMRHLIHRHEPAVPDDPVEIIFSDDDYVVVKKPAGMPVHVSGQYRKNTVLGILQAMHSELLPLLPVHRLDKPVSGVLLFARNPQTADKLRLAINGGETEKIYVARVLGCFEQLEMMVDAPLAWDPKENKAFVGTGMDVLVEEDTIEIPDKKQKRRKKNKSVEIEGTNRGTHRVYRVSKTRVRLLFVAEDKETSVVECQPLTDRTHQIRAHLSHIGHPIANDALYGGWESGHKSVRMLSTGRQLDGPASIDDHVKIVYGNIYKHMVPEDHRDAVCPHCPFYMPKNYPLDLSPLWLHARRYKIEGKEFEASVPVWATSEYKLE